MICYFAKFKKEKVKFMLKTKGLAGLGGNKVCSRLAASLVADKVATVSEGLLCPGSVLDS